VMCYHWCHCCALMIAVRYALPLRWFWRCCSAVNWLLVDWWYVVGTDWWYYCCYCWHIGNYIC
jgi:hypothetical protein